MARCGCGGTSCTCQVTAGPNVTVTGTGSAANPFVISAVGATLSEGDDITITGSGTAGDPYVINAETDCSEVRQCLSAGAGITYNNATGVISATAGNLVTGCGVSGLGTAGDPLVANVGTWPFPCDLETFASFVYCDENGDLRATPPGGFDRVVQQTQTAYPNVLVPGGNDVTVETQSINIQNPSNCRQAFVLVEQEVEVSVNMPIDSTAQWGIGTDDMVYRFNNGDSAQNSVTSQHTKVVSRILAPGALLVESMNVSMGRGSGGANYNRIQTWLQAFIFNLA